MKIKKILYVICLLLFCFCMACSSKNQESGAVKIDDIRLIPPNSKVVNLYISRKKLVDAWSKGEIFNTIRVIQIFPREGETVQLPQYRLFGIREGSAYHVLGLQSNDVIVAADGYVIFNPDQFRAYAKILVRQKQGELEVSRPGQGSVLYKYNFVD